MLDVCIVIICRIFFESNNERTIKAKSYSEPTENRKRCSGNLGDTSSVVHSLSQHWPPKVPIIIRCLCQIMNPRVRSEPLGPNQLSMIASTSWGPSPGHVNHFILSCNSHKNWRSYSRRHAEEAAVYLPEVFFVLESIVCFYFERTHDINTTQSFNKKCPEFTLLSIRVAWRTSWPRQRVPFFTLEYFYMQFPLGL